MQVSVNDQVPVQSASLSLAGAAVACAAARPPSATAMASALTVRRAVRMGGTLPRATAGRPVGDDRACPTQDLPAPMARPGLEPGTPRFSGDGVWVVTVSVHGAFGRPSRAGMSRDSGSATWVWGVRGTSRPKRRQRLRASRRRRIRTGRLKPARPRSRAPNPAVRRAPAVRPGRELTVAWRSGCGVGSSGW